MTVYTETEFSALGFYSVIFIPCPFPSTAVATDTGITSASSTKLSKTSIPATTLHQDQSVVLMFCCSCVQVLFSPAIVPSLHTALNCLKPARCWVLHSISESRNSRYLGNTATVCLSWNALWPASVSEFLGLEICRIQLWNVFLIPLEQMQWLDAIYSVKSFYSDDGD